MAFHTASIFRWMQLKRYQYELTFSLYMLTPTEKFVFSKLPQRVWVLLLSLAIVSDPCSCADSFVFLVLSMIIIAATLYLPEHVTTIARRVSFYWGGEESAIVAQQAVTAMTNSWTGVKNVEPEQVIERMGEL